MTKNEVRQDLKMLKMYYAAQKLCRTNDRVIMPDSVRCKMTAYEEAVEQAEDERLRMIYNGVYREGMTQILLAQSLGISHSYVEKLHHDLVNILAARIE